MYKEVKQNTDCLVFIIALKHDSLMVIGKYIVLLVISNWYISLQEVAWLLKETCRIWLRTEQAVALKELDCLQLFCLSERRYYANLGWVAGKIAVAERLV